MRNRRFVKFPNERTIHVSNLNNTGNGSLREAVGFSFSRKIVFDVSGYIDLETPIEITNPYIKILGETSQSGITLRKKEGVSTIFGLLSTPRNTNVHNVLIRNLRLRQGGGEIDSASCLVLQTGHNILVENCSFSWSQDNLVTIYLNRSLNQNDKLYNVTIRNCIFSEPFINHATGLFISGGNTNDQWNDVNNILIYENLFHTVNNRTPYVGNNGTEFFNNIVYNWGPSIGRTQGATKTDIINNYYRPGPDSDPVLSLPGNRGIQYETYLTHTPSIYVAGNYIENEFEDENADNWSLMKYATVDRTPLEVEYKRNNPISIRNIPTATQIFSDVLTKCGAFPLDSTDTRVKNEVLTYTGNGNISNMNDVGGWPEL